MPFKASFSCLWCGTAHAVRGRGDVEGWAQLCPACIGRAGENGFLRFRLHRALAERAAADGSPGVARSAAEQLRSATERTPTPAKAVLAPAGAPPVAADEVDDRFLRRGRHAHGPIHDAAWHAELDAAGRWLDGLPLRGEIVELAAGTGWWSTLLAAKGTLTSHDADEGRLDRARERLLAHRLRAHLHVRDPWAEPERLVDAVVIDLWLAGVTPDRLAAMTSLGRRWLRPGGLLVVLLALPDPYVEATGEPPGSATDDGPAKPAATPDALRQALLDAGLGDVHVATTGRFFALGRGTA